MQPETNASQLIGRLKNMIDYNLSPRSEYIQKEYNSIERGPDYTEQDFLDIMKQLNSSHIKALEEGTIAKAS